MADADDVMQQALVVAWRRRDVIPAEPWAWFATVVVNCARNHNRKETRLRRREGTIQRPDGNVTVLPPGELAELKEKLLVALAQLPEAERAAVTLCHMAGLTQQEASSELGIALNTLKSHVKRGLDRMRRQLAPHAADLEAYLAGVAFLPPPAGWTEAAARWQSHAASSTETSTSPSILILKVLAGVAVPLGLLMLAWSGLSLWGNSRTGHTQTASVPYRAPNDVGLGTNELSQDGGEPANNGASIAGSTNRSPAGRPAGPGLTPLPSEEIGRSETRPTGDNPIGTLQFRFTYYASGPVYEQWTELVTASGPELHGAYDKFYIDGSSWETSQFVHGYREGPWTTYHENGALACQGEFQMGEKSGLWTWFYDNGQKMAEGGFENGQKSSTWRAWHDNGMRRLVETYVDGRRHGLSTYYDDHGRKTREVEWKHGTKMGPELEFDEEGTLLPSDGSREGG